MLKYKIPQIVTLTRKQVQEHSQPERRHSVMQQQLPSIKGLRVFSFRLSINYIDTKIT